MISAEQNELMTRIGPGGTLVLDHSTVGGDLTVSPGGTVTSSPAGIDCGATCSASFGAGTQVTLTASPANLTFSTTCGGGAVTRVAIAASASAATFFFKGNTPETVVITAWPSHAVFAAWGWTR